MSYVFIGMVLKRDCHVHSMQVPTAIPTIGTTTTPGTSLAAAIGETESTSPAALREPTEPSQRGVETMIPQRF